MPFDTALSGIRAASSDLSVTGNNIANASTTGFKRSRVEFGDVYATSVLGAGSGAVGSGVRLQDVAQNFNQGSVAFTENELDLAINGNGFFIVQDRGEQFYTRAGAFGLDSEGYIVNSQDGRLQGFPADSSGEISGIQDDVQIQTSNLPPQRTTGVSSLLNLDASEPVLSRVGNTLGTTGNAIGVTQYGLQTSTTTTASGTAFNLPFNPANLTFDVSLSATTGNGGTVNVDLTSAAGVPTVIDNFNDLRTLAGVINDQIFQPAPPQTQVDVVVTAVDDGGGDYHLDFQSVQEGEASQIIVSNGGAGVGSLGLPLAADPDLISTAGIAAVNNGYPAQSIEVTDEDGQSITYTSGEGATAATTASELNALTGVSATASTTATFFFAGFQNSANNLVINVNGVDLESNTLSEFTDDINELSATILPGITAELDPVSGDVTLMSSVGDDLTISISSPDDGDTVEVQGNSDAPSVVLEADPGADGVAGGSEDATDSSIVIGGQMNITLDEGYAFSNAQPPSIGLFGPFTATAFEEIVLNDFDPSDQGTYNSATSMTVFDSLGNPHIMSQFFVRQDYNPSDTTTSPNHWVMYVQIDGQEVGDPDTNLAPPENTLPTQAAYNLYFNEDGSLDTLASDDILISNWTPSDDEGNANGADGPLNALAGGDTIIPDPPTSSNFVIDLEGTTQFGSEFSVNSVDQNGFTTGRLSGLNIDDSGIIFARFTNGESQVLGQIALADFANTEGLQPVGESMWAENFKSGQPNIGTPGSAALGAVQSGALEESNVDLSEELVNLILAQRNFQANSKTIETANQVTQTIINLR